MGHPRKESLCAALAESYASGLRHNELDVEVIHLRDLEYDHLIDPRHSSTALEPDILTTQQKIREAGHVTFVYPTWWGSFPALLKSFLDRVFLSGFAFQFRPGKARPIQLLQGRTARILVTMDAPYFFFWLFQGAPGIRALRDSTLRFCGFRMLGTNIYDRIRVRSKEQIQLMIQKARAQGEQDRKSVMPPAVVAVP